MAATCGVVGLPLISDADTGRFAGREVISGQEMVQKVNAAVDARRGHGDLEQRCRAE
ncbi:MAG TPA: hypothetical protein VJ914_16725 [Pseudonocardiaceae bacterium]|nr:hypothetical protein [Pseudonocardiaceae bacterium]